MWGKARACRAAGALLLAGTMGASAEAPPVDPEVARGVALVDQGDYDAAIVVLDAAVRRLAPEPAKVSDLSDAYLHLGIAYVGKGHEAAAKAKFREAVLRMKDLSLSADRYPPKVIDLFEAARQEARSTAPPPPATSTAPPAAPARKGGGPGKLLLVVGGVAAAGAGVAVIAGGGGGSADDSSTSTSGQTVERMETIPAQEQRIFSVTPSRAGTLQAQVTWRNRELRIEIDCQEHDPPYTGCEGNYVRTSDTSASFTVTVQQKQYDVILSNWSDVATPETCTVVVRYP